MKQSTVNAAGHAFCAPHFSTRLDFIPKGSLVFSLGRRISVALDEDGTSSFISSLHLRPAVPLRISWTAIEPRSPLVLRAGPHSLSFPPPFPSPKLPSAAFSVFLSPCSALAEFPVHRCHPSPSWPVTFFVHAISLDPPARRFFSFLTPGLGP